MWKLYSRLVRDPLERKLLKKENVENKRNVERKECCLLPAIIRLAGQKWRFDFRTTSNGEDQRDERCDGDTCNTTHHMQCTWLDALAMNSGLILGWSVTKKLHLKRDQITELEKNRSKCIFKYLLPRPVLTQPKFNFDFKQLSGALSRDSPQLPVFGPITIEEALNEACEGVKGARDNTVGEVEDRLGVRCMERKQYDKAIVHFSAGSALRNSNAAFHLGQCYELGYGTDKDLHKAASYYVTASSLGHRTAMYNLAVFYAHGWGGLQRNADRTAQLLAEAAALGQPDAKLALRHELDESKETETVANRIRRTSAVYSDVKINDRCDSRTDSESDSKSNDRAAEIVAGSAENVTALSDERVLYTDVYQNQTLADYYAGFCYENGFGVKRDVTKAISQYSKAASNGNSEAMYNLAACYEETASNDKTQIPLIIDLYRKAASQGHHFAKERLSILEVHEIFGTLKDYFQTNSEKINMDRSICY